MERIILHNDPRLYRPKKYRILQMTTRVANGRVLRRFLDRYPEHLSLNEIIEPLLPEGLHNSYRHAAKERYKQRFGTLMDALNIDRKALKGKSRQQRFSPGVARFITFIMSKMDGDYLAEFIPKGHITGTLDEKVERVTAFRDEVMPVIESIENEDERDFCLLLLYHLANDEIDVYAKQLVERIRGIGDLIQDAPREFRAATWLRMTHLLDEFAQDLRVKVKLNR